MSKRIFCLAIFVLFVTPSIHCFAAENWPHLEIESDRAKSGSAEGIGTVDKDGDGDLVSNEHNGEEHSTPVFRNEGKPSIVDSKKHRVSGHLPDSLLTWGKVEANGTQILTAGADETLTIEVVTTRDIPVGHNIELWSHFVSDMERPQMTDSDGRAFFSFQTDVAAKGFVQSDAKVHGPGSYFPYRRYAGISLEQDAPAGTRIAFRIAGVSMQTYEETLFNLRIVILHEASVVGYLGDAFYVVKGTAPAKLYLVAPTCVELNEPFDLKIVIRDRFGNKTGDPKEGLSFNISLAEGSGALQTGDIVFDDRWQHHIVKDVTLNAEGPHYLSATLKGKPAISGVSNPVVVRESWSKRVYWGDLHQHAYYHDGRGTPAANIEYAISTSCLDFLTIAEHQASTINPPSIHMSGAPPQTGWEELQAAAEAYNGDDIVAILGSEVSSLSRVAGHMNAYYLDINNRPELERMGLFARSEGRIERLYGDLATFYTRYLDELERSTGEFLLLPHAHACGGPGKFDLPRRPEYQTNIEISSVHGVFEEFYRQWLKNGHFVGVHGSGDNHMTSTGNANPGWHYPNTGGLAAAVATSRNRKGIFDAIRGRRTYGVTGNQRMHMTFRISDEGTGTAEMGDIAVGSLAENRDIAFTVAGTAPVMKVELFRNNEVIASYAPPLAARETLRLAWTDSWHGRRVDDSETTGVIALSEGSLDVVEALHMFHRTDRFTASDGGDLNFRTNGYSGITRGAILKVTSGGKDPALSFRINDVRLGEVLLDETIPVPLSERRSVVARPLGKKLRPPCFTCESTQPEFILEADWVDTGWPKAVDFSWTDTAGTDPAFYYVRVEQIDGNIGWSSPIWFVHKSPFEE